MTHYEVVDTRDGKVIHYGTLADCIDVLRELCDLNIPVCEHLMLRRA